MIPLPPTSLAHYRKSDAAEQSVSEHVRGVSSLAGIHASKIGLRGAAELIGLLHDFGKYSLAFQRYLKSAEGLINPDEDEWVDAGALKGKIDHSTAGSQYVWNHLSAKPGLGLDVGQMLAVCIASHHSGLIDCISAGNAGFGEDVFTRRMKKARLSNGSFRRMNGVAWKPGASSGSCRLSVDVPVAKFYD